MKTPPENNHPGLPLGKTDGAKPITQTHATAAQIAAALGFDEIDETFLRNRVREGLVPKPRNSLYEINATTIGILKFYRARGLNKSELPAQYPSMQAMAAALGIFIKSIKWLLKNGAAEAQDDHHRIKPLPVVRRAFAIIEQIADGNVTGIDGMEQWNHQTELAKKLRLESEKLADEQKIRRGQMLLNRDGTAALEDFVVEDVLNDLRERPLRAALVKLDKTINRQHKNIIQDEAKSRQCATVTTASIQTMLEKIRQKLPAPKTQPDAASTE